MAVFFNTYAGMYLAQSVLHAFFAAAIVEIAMKTWRIANPLVKQRFRMIPVVFPVVSFPVYQALNPARGTASFRSGALFDINAWFALEFWGIVSVGFFFAVVLVFTSLVFVLQEMVPVLRHISRSGEAEVQWEDAMQHPRVRAAVEALGVKVDAQIIEDDEYVLFSSTGREKAVYLSTGLVDALDDEQLKAAIAHEVAHISRSAKPMLIVVFVLRALMFFNPVALLMFRKVAEADEKICDDTAVSLTGNPGALASTLEKFQHTDVGAEDLRGRKLHEVGRTIEDYGHNLLIESRIKRLRGDEAGGGGKSGGVGWPTFTAVLIVITVFNYFIV